ncbi:hypothetical protein SIID45300_01859 [Candidatus Magnetaquicoccaceae bacterium FCR-1]|uniref:Uncharacterized protein n=1 Tax=Candidatus Magnetaquiglobus chichijimensis TaxID=3141448 RepID=A0ABQ0C9G4_9PROT
MPNDASFDPLETDRSETVTLNDVWKAFQETGRLARLRPW